MKLSLEKIAVVVRMREHLLGLPAWLAKLESPQAGGSEGSQLCCVPSQRSCLSDLLVHVASITPLKDPELV